MHPMEAARELSKRCGALAFDDPVSWTYNPLEYAWDGHRQYVQLFGDAPKRVLFVGMNPGPWGMGQTGIPFGDPDVVREMMGITGIDVHEPPGHTDERPVYGLESPRNEVSGTRLYEGLRDACGTLKTAYQHLYVANYCPLLFFDEDASNLTPPRLRRDDRTALFEVCDTHLSHLVDHFDPQHIVAVGRFAERRTDAVLEARSEDRPVHYLLHPSPANPQANKDGGEHWRRQLFDVLDTAGIESATA